MVDDDGAFSHTGQRPILTQYDASEVVIIADTEEDKVGALGGLSRRLEAIAAVFAHPGDRLFLRSVVDAEAISCARQMPGHRRSHHAEPNKCDGFHGTFLPLSKEALNRCQLKYRSRLHCMCRIRQ